VLSTFSGLGGLDLGLERAGFRVIGCVESDPVARSSLRANAPRWHQIDPGDIESVARETRPRDLGLEEGELSLLSGAPPCQPYSKAALWSNESWRGFSDLRAKPLLCLLELVELFLPKAVLLENVQGFVDGRHSVSDAVGKLLAGINQRRGTSYQLQHMVVDAADYGVPQRRRRAIMVAFRDGSRFEWPEKTHIETPMTAWDALADLRPLASVPMATGKWAELLPSIPEGQNYLFHTPRGDGKPIFGYRTRYWSFLLKLSRTLPAWTISAQPGPSVGPFHWDNRPLAKEELLVLQSFPVEWYVEGSRREQVRQIGNATPPLLAEVLGRSIARALTGREFPERPSLALTSRGPAPRPRKPAAVPESYNHLLGPKPDHPGEGRGPRPRQAASAAVL